MIGLVALSPRQAMEANTVRKFLIDGFPRNKDNLDGWEKQMEGKADVKFVLFLECPEEVRSYNIIASDRQRSHVLKLIGLQLLKLVTKQRMTWIFTAGLLGESSEQRQVEWTS